MTSLKACGSIRNADSVKRLLVLVLLREHIDDDGACVKICESGRPLCKNGKMSVNYIKRFSNWRHWLVVICRP